MYFLKKLKEVCYANIHIYYAWQFSFHLEDLIFHLVFLYSLKNFCSTSCSEDLLATNSLVFVYLKCLYYTFIFEEYFHWLTGLFICCCFPSRSWRSSPDFRIQFFVWFVFYLLKFVLMRNQL